MAGTKVSQLTIGDLSDDDWFLIVDNGVTKKISVATLRAESRAADVVQDSRLAAVEAANVSDDNRLDYLEGVEAMMLEGNGAGFETNRDSDNCTPSAAYPGWLDCDGYWPDGSAGRRILLSRTAISGGKQWAINEDITHTDSGKTLRKRYGLATVVV